MKQASRIKAKFTTNKVARRADRRYPTVYAFYLTEPTESDVQAVAYTIKSVADRAMEQGLSDPLYQNLKHNSADLLSVKGIKLLTEHDKAVIHDQIECYITIYEFIAEQREYPPVSHAQRFDYFRAKQLLSYPLPMPVPLAIENDDPEFEEIVSGFEALWLFGVAA